MKRVLAALVGALVAGALAAAEPPRSGADDMSAALQAMQRDEAANPGMLWVADGEALWRRPAGRRQVACASCHGDAAVSMRGVAARYPAFDAEARRPVTLGERIAACRRKAQGAAPPAPESAEALGLEAYVAHQSRGLPLAPSDDARLAPFRAQGEALFRQRFGQLDLSCAQCHEQRAGRHLGGSTIPQGHPNGYPLYRLEWQSLGSLQRRLRNCMTGVRAEAFAYGAPEWVALELYLATRARGLAVETPAVRP